MTTPLLAAAILLLGASAAMAAPRQTALLVTAPAQDGGSEALPAGHANSITFGGDLPTNGGEGIVQSVNSLPLGFTNGTAADIQARINARYFQAQAASQGRATLAAR